MSIRVDTYHSSTAPAHRAWMAFIAAGREHCPIFFKGPSEQSVIDMANEFWAGEQKKQQARLDAAEARRVAQRARTAA